MKRKKGLSRAAALSARPERVAAARCEERENGGLLVTLRLPRRRLARWLKGVETVERSYGLDALGREVYESCDGKADVRALIRRFEKAHRVSVAEAELAVTTFLRTLMAKGLIVMGVEKELVR